MNKKIFKIGSIVVIVGLIIFYGYRLIHYYKIYNPKGSSDEVVQTLLSKKIINESYVNNNLVLSNDVYNYIGKTTNNYLKYSGMLWQIISINKEKEIKIVLKDNLVNLVNNDSFDKSYIKDYLIDETSNLYKNLESPEAYLTDTLVCLDEVTDIEELTCNTSKKYKIGLLSLNDYAITGGINGFLNNDSDFWLSNYNADALYYVSSNNQIETTKVNHNYGVRPVVTLNKDILFIGGSGTIDDPYLLGEEKNPILNQKNINEYISFSNKTWKIIAQEDIGTKVLLNEPLQEKMIFAKKENLYKDTSIYDYLNKDFYNNLENKDKIIKGNWYVGYYNNTNNYNYKSIYESKIEGYVGLLNLNDFFINTYSNTFTLTPVSENSRTVYVVNDDNQVYGDTVNKNRNIIPVIYLDSNMQIKSGTGSLEDPYIMEVNNETEER